MALVSRRSLTTEAEAELDAVLLPRVKLMSDILFSPDCKNRNLNEILALGWVKKRSKAIDWRPSPTNIGGLKRDMALYDDLLEVDELKPADYEVRLVHERENANASQSLMTLQPFRGT